MIEPYHILWYDSMKKDGTIPNLRIGKYCSIAHNCTFIMSQHVWTRVTTSQCDKMLWSHSNGNPSSYCRGDIHVGNDVWIGANCTILDNINIGDGAVIAAGSVVTKDVPPYGIVGGNPAKMIRYRFTPTQIQALLDIKWWDFSPKTQSKLDIWTEDIDAFIAKAKQIIADGA